MSNMNISIDRAKHIYETEGIGIEFNPSYLGYHTLDQVKAALNKGYLSDVVIDHYDDEWDEDEKVLLKTAYIEVNITPSGCEEYPFGDDEPLPYGPEPECPDPEPEPEPDIQALHDLLRTPVVPVVETVAFRHEPRGYSYIDVTLSDKSFHEGIIRYFNDELTFWASDLMGLTEQGVRDYHMRQDSIYLRS